MKKVDVIFLLSSVFCLLSFLWFCKALFLGYYPDFSGYYYGSLYFLQGINPYEGGGSLYTQYVYPPPVLLLFIPLTFLEFNAAGVVWNVLNILFLLASLRLLTGIFKINFFAKINLIFVGFVLVSFPAKFSMGMGQINLLVLLLLCLFLLLIKKGKDFLGGTLLGAALVIKMFPVFLPLYLFIKIKKRKLLIDDEQTSDTLRILSGIALVFVVSVMIVTIFIPADVYKHFLFDTLPSFFTSWKIDYYNQSVSGFVGRAFGIGTLGLVLKNILVGVIAIVTIYITSKNEHKNFYTFALKFGLLVSASLIVNNFSWQHHFIWLVIPFFVCLLYLQKIKARWFMYYLLLLSGFLVSINMPDPGIYHIFYQSHVLYGTFILWGLSIYLLRHPHRI